MFSLSAMEISSDIDQLDIGHITIEMSLSEGAFEGKMLKCVMFCKNKPSNVAQPSV